MQTRIRWSFSTLFFRLRVQTKKKLTALLFETKEDPRGTVVHFHGNFGNVSNHFPQVHWLVDYGYDVLTFDYQGYGGSEGKPNPKNTVEDGLAMVQYAYETNRNADKHIATLGQSLGGAVSIVVAAKDKRVQAVIVEAAFSSYRSIARHALAHSLLLWPAYPIYPFLLTRKYDPIRFVDKITPRPILFIHGEKDRVIPIKMTEKLFKKANEPKTLWKVSKAGHLQCLILETDHYKKKVVNFLEESLGSKIPVQIK